MAGLKRFQYVDKDHDAIVADCIARIKETYGEDAWNDFEEDSTGVMLVEAFAYICDLLLFYLDRQANETYLPTATERQNLINLCKLIGYRPAGAQAAQADITVSIKAVCDTDVTLPAGSQLETASGVIFEIKEDAVIPAGELSVTVGAIEGETLDNVIGVSDGTASQSFYLPEAGIIEVKEISIGEYIWIEVESLADYSSVDRVYTADLDAWGRVRINFGDGRNGQVPAKNQNINAVYRIGGGLAGNVAPNTITSTRDIASDEYGNRVSIDVTNLDWASGGSEAESIESIKLWAPRYFKTQNRCVTQGDYEAFAMAYKSPDVGAIAKAHAVVRERSGEANFIRLYVLTYGNTAGTVALAPQTLKAALLEYLNDYKMLTDWLEIEDGKWRAIDFKGIITISAGIKSTAVLDSVTAALKTLLSVETREMGEYLRISDVYAAIDNIEGVVHVELEVPINTLSADENELLILGDIDFSFKIQGAGMRGTNF